MTPDDEALCVNVEARRHAHEVLDRWLDSLGADAQRVWGQGRSGPVGKLFVRARVDDDGVSLHIERTTYEDL